MDNIQKAVKGVKWTSLSMIINTVLQMLQLSILTRFLSASEFGLMAIVTFIIGYSISFIDIGLSNAIIHKQNVTHKQLSSLYWLNVISGIIVFLIIFNISSLISEYYKEERLSYLIKLVSITFLIIPFGQQFEVLFQKDLKFNIIAKVEIISTLFQFFSSIFLVFNSYGILSIVYSNLLKALITTILYIIMGLKLHKPSLSFNFNDIKEFARFGIFQMLDKSLNYFAANLDKLLIGKFFGMEFVGIYNLAYQLMIKPMVVISPVINKVAFPLYARIQNDINLLNKIYIDNIKLMTFISFPVYFGMFSVSSELINLLYGEQWEKTIGVFNIIWASGAMWTLGTSIGSYLLALGKPDIGFYSNILRLFLVISAILIGSKFSFEIMIICLVSIDFLFMLPLDYYIRYKLTQMEFFEHVKSYFFNLINSIIMCLIVKVFKSYFHTSRIELNLIIFTIVGILSYTILTFIFNKDILKQIKNII